MQVVALFLLGEFLNLILINSLFAIVMPLFLYLRVKFNLLPIHVSLIEVQKGTCLTSTVL